VSSVVAEVITLIETAVGASVPLLVASRNYYNLEKNDGVKNAYIYAVRPGSASSVAGVIRSATLEQEFEIEIAREFIEKATTDLAIREAVEQIYLDNELILKEITLRRSGNILKVGEPSYSAPEINQNQKSVSIIFTYPITYRKSIRGDI
jgi:hypothetical protein